MGRAEGDLAQSYWQSAPKPCTLNPTSAFPRVFGALVQGRFGLLGRRTEDTRLQRFPTRALVAKEGFRSIKGARRRYRGKRCQATRKPL